MIPLTEANVELCLAKVELEKGLRKYIWLQKQVWDRDVSTDREFQQAFNSFYRVRQRSAAWYCTYYQLMERLKSKQQLGTFDDVLGVIHQETGRVEASFASKLVATLDPTKPVVDRFVLAIFGIHPPAPAVSDRLAKWSTLYRELCEKHTALAEDPLGILICKRFSDHFPWAKITDLKKVDLVLWQAR